MLGMCLVGAKEVVQWNHFLCDTLCAAQGRADANRAVFRLLVELLRLFLDNKPSEVGQQLIQDFPLALLQPSLGPILAALLPMETIRLDPLGRRRHQILL